MPAQNASCMLVFLILHLTQNQLNITNMTLGNNTEEQNYIEPLQSINLTRILPCENFILNQTDYGPLKPAKSYSKNCNMHLTPIKYTSTTFCFAFSCVFLLAPWSFFLGGILL